MVATDSRGGKQIIEEHFDCDPWGEDWSPRYNIASTQPVPVIGQHLAQCCIEESNPDRQPGEAFFEELFFDGRGDNVRTSSHKFQTVVRKNFLEDQFDRTREL